MKGTESTRLSIKMRGGSLGHHQAMEKEERFSSWRSEDMARLAWTLGAMAAEHVFYGENTRGVGGDVQSATSLAAMMVGAWGMAPPPVPVSRGFDDETPEQTKERVEKRLEQLGRYIMNSTRSGGMQGSDPVAAVLGSADERKAAAQILGHAFVMAYNLVRLNKDQIEVIAQTLADKRELHGNEVVRLLEGARLQKPEIDLAEESAWPTV
jgi:ATP-dependent Zn protease